jgi:hypothetical protein
MLRGRLVVSLVLIAAAGLAPRMVAAAESGAAPLVILPAHIELSGPRSLQHVVVQRAEGNELVSQISEDLEWESSDPQIAVVTDGVVRPMANGTTKIVVRAAGAVAEATVVVQSMEQPQAWSFRNDVEPILTKAGCNSGACHGALAGKGGFRLTLRGYDPNLDFFTMTRQARGRRIELADPGRSLILAKPSGALPHKGGLRFDTASDEYQILSQWIAAGAPGPDDQDPRVTDLEIWPAGVLLAPGDRQQLLVRARYSDGRLVDVTRWSRFSSTNEAVATIDDAGLASVIGSGEGAVTASFASQVVIARIAAPYPHKIDPSVYAQSAQRNFIDELVLRQLERLHIAPSPPASDEEFMRRAFLDTIGGVPTPEEIREFLADTRPNKRDRLIDSLLNRPEFVDYWTYKWSDILLINGQLLRPDAVKAYYQWVREQVANNRPWDEFVREIVTSQGSSFENGATNFFALHQDPESMTENVCQAFLGLSIGCAKCHNHPLEKWTNNQYYAMANLFARVRAKGWGGDSRNGDGKRTLYVARTGELIQPLTGKPQPPTPLDGEPLPFEATEDRREYLAEWLTSVDNPYFSRAITNRVWANFFGVGLVEQIDDMRVSNPASNDELLAAASRFLVDNQFDLKALMRAILQSETYQRSSQPLPENENEGRFYSRYYPRRMMAEVLLDAISQVTEVPTEFNEIAYPGADKQKTDFYPKGTRALQLYDSAVASYFLNTFGRNERLITCECERSNEPSLVQVLHLSNGDTINQKLKVKGNRLDKLLEAGLDDRKLVEEAYLLTLSRFPTEQESQQLGAVLHDAAEADRREVLEDLFWSLMTSREFLFHR